MRLFFIFHNKDNSLHYPHPVTHSHSIWREGRFSLKLPSSLRIHSWSLRPHWILEYFHLGQITDKNYRLNVVKRNDFEDKFWENSKLPFVIHTSGISPSNPAVICDNIYRKVPVKEVRLSHTNRSFYRPCREIGQTSEFNSSSSSLWTDWGAPNHTQTIRNILKLTTGN